MTTYLLVHGAMQGGWVWRKVAPLLCQAGHDVFTPTLTGLGERAHLGHAGIDLDTHIADIMGVIEAEELDDMVLVGHSYAGRVISGVAETMADRIAALVYVDAFVPQAGDSSFSGMNEEAAARVRQAAQEKGDGWRVPARTAEALGVRDPVDRAWMDRLMIGQPIGCMEQAFSYNEPWRRVASLTYIHCTQNSPSPFGAIAAKYKDDPAWTSHEMQCGHMPAVDLPAELTEILLGATG